MIQFRFLQVCPRCCLRFAGIRDAVYAVAAPAPAALSAAVQKLLQPTPAATQSPAGQQLPFADSRIAVSACVQCFHTTMAIKGGVLLLCADTAKPASTAAAGAEADTTDATSLQTRQQSAAATALTPAPASSADAPQQPEQLQLSDPTAAASAQQSATGVTAPVAAAGGAVNGAASPNHDQQSTEAQHQQQGMSASAQAFDLAAPIPCPACLVVLQGPEKTLASVPPNMLAGLPEAEGNAGKWKCSCNGSVEALASCIRYVTPPHVTPPHAAPPHVQTIW